MENERPDRATKRPTGWSKPYWGGAGLYVCVLLMSFLVSLLVVGFLCGIILRAAIPAEPIVWRTIEMALDVFISVGVAWYFSTREGYSRRAANSKVMAVGGLWFMLSQCPVALLLSGAPYAAGPLASTLAQLIYFGNQSLFASGIEAAPPLLIVGCAVLADGLVLIPTMTIGERVGARVFRKEEAELTKKP